MQPFNHRNSTVQQPTPPSSETETSRPWEEKNSKRLRQSKRWGITSLGAVILLAGMGIGAIQVMQTSPSADPQTQSAADLLPVETLTVELTESYQVSRYYTGEVVARRASELGFERAGELVELNVEQGDRVTQGMPLAKLDTRNLEAQRQALLAQKAQAEAVLAELEAGPRAEDIAAARAAVKDLQEQLALEQTRRQRREYLYSEGAIAKEQLDEVAFNAEALAARLDQAQSRLEELLVGTRTESIAAQRAAVQQLTARIQDLDISIDKSTIKAPFDGTVAARRVDEGTVVSAGQAVVRLVENNAPEVEIGVPVEVAAQLQPRMQRQVRIGETPYPAEVSAIVPEIDPATRTQTVVLKLAPSAVFRVAPGQVARLEVTQATAEAGYWLPTTALVRGDRGLWSVYALVATPDANGDRVERRDVEVLHTAGDAVFVRGTLQPGDLIIKSGTQRIVPGQLVRPIR